MADDFPRDRPHLFLPASGQAEKYQRPRLDMRGRPLPTRDRASHARDLERAMGEVIAAAHKRRAAADPNLASGAPGFYLEVQIPRRELDVVDALADRRQRMEVVSVRSDANGDVLAAVFVPNRAEQYYLRKIEAYKTRDTNLGRPRNEPLLSRIDTFRLGTVSSLFTDDATYFPIAGEKIWWEVWLRDGRRESFERLAGALNLPLRGNAIRFPEREVVLAWCDEASMQRILDLSDVIAEIRRAKDTPAIFMAMNGGEQRAWQDELLERLEIGADDSEICILDSGISRSHPLIAPVLAAGDCLTVNPAWGTDDTADWHGHGTSMAGLSLYGDLVGVTATNSQVDLPYRLESVRILPPLTAPHTDPDLYGAITAEAVARAEVANVKRRRVFAMAVTASTVNGRPSSWSAEIDQLCADAESPRLMLLSVGNIRQPLKPSDYLVVNDTEALEDPAQAWNAISIGAFTQKVDITETALAGYSPIAPAGDLSPTSRTSVIWERQWPLKPEVVFEGGNLAHDGENPGDTVDDLQLLTTYYRHDIRPFTTLGDTSAATALAARMAGSIMANRPGIWAETVRALIVHSAEWTPAMRAHIVACGGNKARMEAVVRRYGYGVPELARALRSTRNDLSLVVEDSLQPFQRSRGEDGSQNSTATLREMNLHRLPWPREELLALGDAQVELRVTLSYFIEPNPGERGWRRRHRYASHGLRFRMKSATETLDEFRARINQVVRDAEEGTSSDAGADEWILGSFRDKGSIHSDRWEGSAVDLAERDAIGVFPIGGWWKEKPYLERYNMISRYSLIVTIRAPGSNVDIYTPVATKVLVAAEVET